MFQPVLICIIGLVLLAGGAECLVRGGAYLARIAAIHQAIIGAVILGFGTSTPELVTSLVAAHEGKPEIALGNVLGSNVANIGLILGLSALIRRIKVSDQALTRDLPLVAGSAVLLWFLSLDGRLGRLDGFLLLASLGIYLWICLKDAINGRKNQEKTSVPKNGVPLSIIAVISGLAMLLLGAHWFVDSAIEIARMFGVTTRVIALTLVSVGTSLPELATSVMAAMKGSSDLSLGNILGSNIFNICGIAGLAAILAPVTAYSGLATQDIPALLLFSALLLLVALRGRDVSRFEGAFFLIAYIIFVVIVLQ